MRKKIMSLTTLALAGGVTVGVLGLNQVAQADTVDDAKFAKRDDDVPSLVLVDDDDDDDTNDNTNTRNSATKNSVNSKASRDNTKSNHTKVSRDRDLSRGDKTRDWTNDGGDKTRDRSANHTNDKSRNDTRR